MNKNRKELLEEGAKGQEVSIDGIIVPYESDARFRTTSILLSTDRELDFVIEGNAMGALLFKHLRESVSVKGFIREKQPGKWEIRITDYKVLI